MPDVQTLLNRYKAQGAWLAPPAAGDKLPAGLPSDYADFLKAANGLQHSGIILFGTAAHDTADPGKNLPAARRGENGDWTIGRTTDGAVFLFNSAVHAYLLIDSTSGDEYDRWKSLGALLEDYID